MRTMVPTNKIIPLLKSLVADNAGNLEAGKDLTVDGKVILNAAEDLVDKEGNELLGSGGAAYYDPPESQAYATISKESKKGDLVLISVWGNNKVFGVGVIRSITQYSISIEGLFSGNTTKNGYLVASTVRISSSSEYVSFSGNFIEVPPFNHCVKITGTDTSLCFTAKNQTNTVVDSYQDLHSLFGGDQYNISGTIQSKTPLYIDLHGGNIATNFIYCTDGTKIMLSSIESIAFADDVFKR